ncbi:MAG: tetratricopeptide repeat protein [Burkholderiales bacterium]|nr:tetratricopeptide repeat protein [Burkholderiales bacterium]
MSLLLEALKRAEKAKAEAERRARGATQAGDADPEPTAAQPAKHVTTREDLPPISAPLEIATDDLGAPEAKKPARELSLEEVPPAPPAAPRSPERREGARAASEATARNRATAQKVFEAKMREPNPRLPFYITLGVLGVAAVAIFVYFWIQLRPPPPLVNPNPPQPPGEAPTALAQAKPAEPTPAAQPPAPQPEIPGLPAVSAPSAQAAQPAIPPAPAAAPATPAPQKPSAGPAAPEIAKALPPAAKPSARAAAAPSPARTAAADQAALSVRRPELQVHPRVESGFAAYHAGDLARARADYEAALRDDPGNRDALLGLAAVEMRAQRYAEAEALYQKLLAANPRDPHAQAGLLALRAQILDPVIAESRVKTLLAGDPDAAALHFALGNQYALQARWAEAQQAYFRAWVADPENPDFAYNLAVSLDQLRQSALAAEYYRRALALAERRAANFPLEVARQRAAQLAR